MNDGSSLLHPEPRPSHIRKNFLGLWAPAPAPAAVPGRASLFLSSPAPLQRLREKAATRLYTFYRQCHSILKVDCMTIIHQQKSLKNVGVSLSDGGGSIRPNVVSSFVRFICSNRCPPSPDLCSATYFFLYDTKS